MISFLLHRASDPAAMPIAQPEHEDPWTLTWNEGIRRWSVQLLDNTELSEGAVAGRDGLDSLLAFVAYLGCPIKITGNGRGIAPELVILDVVSR
jgi:hypothetical protein